MPSVLKDLLIYGTICGRVVGKLLNIRSHSVLGTAIKSVSAANKCIISSPD